MTLREDTPREDLGLSEIIARAIALATEGEEHPVGLTEESRIVDVAATLSAKGGKVTRMLAEAALVSFRQNGVNGPRTLRDGLEFYTADRRTVSELVYTEKSSVRWHLEPEVVQKALLGANRTIELIHDVAASNNAPIFELLGLRNLSSFVGEIFAGALRELYAERFLRNPNQDGHPDLMALTPEGQRYIRERTNNGELDRNKRHWSPYPFGGVEVKATCGNTPPARRVAKPLIGKARIPILQSAEWKAHHRETNNLLGVYWDFVDGLPTVLAAFFRNDLRPEDWGAVIRPGPESRATSVSIMTRQGVCKMGAGWVVLPKHHEFMVGLTQRRVFNVTDELFDRFCSSREARPTKRRS